MAQLIMKLTTIRQNELLMGSVHLRLQERAGPGGRMCEGVKRKRREEVAVDKEDQSHAFIVHILGFLQG